MLDHYLTKWKLSSPRLLASTFSSDVYLVHDGQKEVVLKLITPAGVEEQKGAIALRYFDGHGAIHLLNEGENAHLLEYVEGYDLVEMVRRGDDETATGIIADVLNRLHHHPNTAHPPGLTPLPVWFRDLFARAQQEPDSIYTRAASLAQILLDEPRDVRVLHGDIHHENIRYHAERGWLAFDPKGLIGERTYDAANTLYNPIRMPELVHDEGRLLKTAAILAEKMGIDYERLLQFVFVYGALSAAWSLMDDFDPTHALTVARMVEAHL